MRWGIVTILLVLAACAKQPPAQIIHKGHNFYGYDSIFTAPFERQIVVKKGDTVYSLAKKHDVPVRFLMDSNNLEFGEELLAGSVLHLPATEDFHEPEVDVMPPKEVIAHNKVESTDLPELEIEPEQEPQQAVVAPQPMYKPSQTNIPGPADKPVLDIMQKRMRADDGTPRPVMRSRGGFIWPLEASPEGKVLSSFGAREGGLYNDGVNVIAEAGEEVMASAAGMVVYAGQELKSYGKLVIIRHDNGWLTAYAHMQDIVIRKGQRVLQRQVIGHVGQTGKVDEPQLHFGIRAGKDTLDPLKHIAF